MCIVRLGRRLVDNLVVDLKEDYLGECNRNKCKLVLGNGVGWCELFVSKCRIC